MLLAIMGSHGLVGCSMDESADEEVSQDSDFLGESDGSVDEAEVEGTASTDDGGGEADGELDAETAQSSPSNEGTDDEFADDDTKTADNSSEDDLDRELASGDDEFDKEFSEDAAGKNGSDAVAGAKDDSLEDLDETAKVDEPQDNSQAVAAQTPAEIPTETPTDVPEPSTPDQVASQETSPSESPLDFSDGGNSSPDGSADPLLAEDSSSNDLPVASTSGPRPLQKILSQPYTKNGRLMNAVYIGRPGDTVEAVSQKIFASDKQNEIIQDNPWLADGIKPGEKLYFNSPNRPADNTMIMSYFEDKNISPESYTALEGDNIRRVSEKLLGYPEAWKEVWATNQNVESKDDLAPGTELKFWKDDANVNSSGLAEANVSSQQPMDLAQIDSGLAQGIPAPTSVVADLGSPTELAAPTDLSNDPLNPQDAFAAPGMASSGGDIANQQSMGANGASSDLQVPVDLNGPQVAMENPASESKEMSSANPSSESSNQNMIFIGVAVLAIAGFGALKLKGKKSSGPVNMEYTQV